MFYIVLENDHQILCLLNVRHIILNTLQLLVYGSSILYHVQIYGNHMDNMITEFTSAYFCVNITSIVIHIFIWQTLNHISIIDHTSFIPTYHYPTIIYIDILNQLFNYIFYIPIVIWHMHYAYSYPTHIWSLICSKVNFVDERLGCMIHNEHIMFECNIWPILSHMVESTSSQTIPITFPECLTKKSITSSLNRYGTIQFQLSSI